MPIEQVVLEQKLRTAFPEADIVITDLIGDQDHYAVQIASSQFKGKKLIEQHRLVNDALKECLGEALHALAIKTIIKD